MKRVSTCAHNCGANVMNVFLLHVLALDLNLDQLNLACHGMHARLLLLYCPPVLLWCGASVLMAPLTS